MSSGGIATLADFHAARRRAAIIIFFAAFNVGMLLGSSPLVFAIDGLFSPPLTDESLEFNGVDSFAISSMLMYWTVALVLLPVYKNIPERRKIVNACLLALPPIGLALAGAGASAGGVLPLLYVGVVGFVGFGSSVYDFLARMDGLIWFAVDGTSKRYGVALCGLGTGSGAIFFTLWNGWIINYGSLALTFYVTAALQIVLTVPIWLGLQMGWLEAPPSVEAYAAMVAKEASVAAEGYEGDGDAPQPDGGEEKMEEDEEEGTDGADSTAAHSSAEDSHGIERGAGPLFPRCYASPYGCLRSPWLWVRVVNFFLLDYAGYTTKVLLSTMFSLIFNLPDMTSAYLSALTLLLYLVARCLVPLLVMDRKINACGLCVAATATSCVVYAVIPVIIGSETFARAAFSWRLFGFILCKSFAGASFALLSNMCSSIVLDDAGPANFAYVCKWLYMAAGLGAAVGPIVGFIITMSRYYLGMSFAEAFHLQFYICAGLAGLNSCIYAVSWAVYAKRKASWTQRPTRSELLSSVSFKDFDEEPPPGKIT